MRVCRVNNPREFAKRGQGVWVKVISMTKDRMSLSMRDVDQETGRDLLPQTKPAPVDDRSNPAGESAFHRKIPPKMHRLWQGPALPSQACSCESPLKSCW